MYKIIFRMLQQDDYKVHSALIGANNLLNAIAELYHFHDMGKVEILSANPYRALVLKSTHTFAAPIIDY